MARVRESNERLSDRLREVKMENKALRHISADYERVKRVFGSQRWRPTNGGSRWRRPGNGPGALSVGIIGKRSRFIKSLVIYYSQIAERQSGIILMRLRRIRCI